MTRLIEKVDELWQFNAGLIRSLNIFHLVGYGFLILTLFDLLEIFVLPRFMNPVWEFQMLGAMVERVPIPLIGFTLVFFGELNLRPQWERYLLRFLSWAALLFAVWFLFLIPLGIVNTVRLDRNNGEEITNKVKQEIASFQQFKNQITAAKTTEEIDNLLLRLDRQTLMPAIADSQQLESVKQQISSSLAKAEMQATTKATETKAARRLTLFKKSIKWNVGALVSACLFFFIWQNTRKELKDN